MEKSNVKVEYDNTYPPLNRPYPHCQDSQLSKQSALQMAMAQAKNTKAVVISPCDKRFKEKDAAFDKVLQSICARMGAEITASISNLGCFVLNVVTRDPSSLEHAKFIVREAFSVQTSKSYKIGEKHLRRFSDKHTQDQLCKDRYLYVRLDNSRGILYIEGGQNSVKAANEFIEDYLSWNSNSVTVSIDIPIGYHNFIRGPNDVTIKGILEQSGKYVEVNCNNESTNSIVLIGNKRCAETARDNILQFYEKLKCSLATASYLVTRVQIREIMNRLPGDLFISEGVSLAVVNKSNGTSVLDIVGESKKITRCLEIVAAVMKEFTSCKINSPYWVCKIFSSYEDFPQIFKKVFINAEYHIFPVEEYIEIFCDASFINDASKRISSLIDDISLQSTFDTLILSDIIAKMLEAKNAEKLRKIESETYTKIFIESNLEKLSIIQSPIARPNNLCVIIGQHQQVKQAKTMIEDQLKFYQSFESVVIDAPNHLHGYVIGAKGKFLNDLIEKYGPNCSIFFGKDEPDLDICTIKGPMSELKEISDVLKLKISEFDSLHHLKKIQIPENIFSVLNEEKQRLIGDIRKIGKLDSLAFPEKTGTDIYLAVMGKIDIVNRVESFVLERINDWSRSVTKKLPIPERLLPVLISFGDVILKAIADVVGGDVRIQLPPKILLKDNLSIFGPASKVETAIETLTKLGSGKSPEYYFDQMKVPRQHVSPLKASTFNLIGPASVKVYFASTSSKDNQETIVILGKMCDVKKVRASFIEEIKILQNTIEKNISIKAEYKKEFLKRRGDEATLIHLLSVEHGNSRIVLGEKIPNTDQIQVSIKGYKDNVYKLCDTINSLVQKFDSRVEEHVTFSIDNLNIILKKNTLLLRTTMNDFNVVISISENYYSAIKENKMNEDCQVRIKGMKEDVDKTVQALKDWVIVSDTVQYPHDIQKLAFGFSTEYYDTVSHNMRVSLDMGFTKTPPVDNIVVTGLKNNVSEAVQFIQRICENNYEIRLDITSKYFTRLIGKRGVAIQKFNSDNSVKVFFPQAQATDEKVVITGSKQNCHLAEQKLLSIVSEWDSIITKELQFSAAARYQLFGPESANIKKISRDYNVSIRHQQVADKASPIRELHITGLPKDVEGCVAHLQQEVDNIMEDLEERYMYERPVNEHYVLDVSALSSLVYVKPSKVVHSPPSVNMGNVLPNKYQIPKIDPESTSENGHDLHTSLTHKFSTISIKEQAIVDENQTESTP